MNVHFSGGRKIRLPLLLTLICLLALPLSPTFIQASGGAQDPKLDAQAAQAMLGRVRELTSHSTKGLKFEKLKNGVSFMATQGRFQHVMLSRKNANGSVSTQCVESEAEARAFLDGATNTIEADTPLSAQIRAASPPANAAALGTNLLANASAPASVAPPNRAQLIIVNGDAPNQGLNDPTPVAPVGGNPGTTLGQQRLFVLQRAADIWGAALQSPVPIRVQVQFIDTDEGFLAAAGTTAFALVLGGSNPNIVPNTVYPYALTNRLFGIDVFPANPPNPQIGVVVNNAVDNFYNGIDNNAPVGQPDFLTVILHEFAHGLGFASFVDTTTGQRLGADDTNPDGGFDDIYSRNLFDVTLGLSWPNMTAAQRLFSVTNTKNLVWTGPNVTAAIPTFQFRQILRVNGGAAPTVFELGPGFGAPIRTPGVTANLALADPPLACGPLNNPAAVNGRIALIDRGACAFVDKARAAQAAGAVGAIIINNVPGQEAPNLAGLINAPDVTIPIVFISQVDGNSLRAQLASGVNATLTLDPTQRAGTTNGRVRMFAPNPSQGGSSVSHWDTSAVPRILMEPTGSQSGNPANA